MSIVTKSVRSPSTTIIWLRVWVWAVEIHVSDMTMITSITIICSCSKYVCYELWYFSKYNEIYSGSYEFFDMSEFALPILCFESLAVGIESYVGPTDFWWFWSQRSIDSDDSCSSKFKDWGWKQEFLSYSSCNCFWHDKQFEWKAWFEWLERPGTFSLL